MYLRNTVRSFDQIAVSIKIICYTVYAGSRYMLILTVYVGKTGFDNRCSTRIISSNYVFFAPTLLGLYFASFRNMKTIRKFFFRKDIKSPPL